MNQWSDERGGTPATDAAPERRPGVPKEAQPESRTERELRDQPGRDERQHRAALDEATPVFGTAQPPRGLSGLMRTAAYRVPEHYARHWMLLLAADRVDVVEDRLGELMAGPIGGVGLERTAARVRSNPLPVLASALVGLWLAKKLV